MEPSKSILTMACEIAGLTSCMQCTLGSASCALCKTSACDAGEAEVTARTSQERGAATLLRMNREGINISGPLFRPLALQMLAGVRA